MRMAPQLSAIAALRIGGAVASPAGMDFFTKRFENEARAYTRGESHMKAFILGTMLVACLIGFESSAQAQGVPGEHSMTGCLAKGDDAGTFKLTDLEKGPKEVVIAETTANLAPHLGHKVEITGVSVPGKDKAHTMKVTAVKMISATCP